MKITLPNHIKKVNAYKPGKTPQQIIEEEGFTEYAVLWNNENALGASPKAREAVIAAFDNSNLYPDPMSLRLRKALAKRLEVQADNIVVGNGGEGILMNILKAFCDESDEFLTSAGSFVIVYIWTKINNINCISIPLTKSYEYDLEAIYNNINERTKIIYLSNINNPTGTMIGEKALRAFIEKVPKHILIIVDEAYYEFSKSLNPDFPNSIPWGYENVITLRTFSKVYGIAGTRVGYAVAPIALIEPLERVKLVFEPSNLAQAAGMGALEDDEFLQKTLENNKTGIAYYYQAFDKLGLNYTPSFGNFVMIDFETPEKANAIFEGLKSKGVFVRLLGGTGLPHCIRITVGTMKENKYCVKCLTEVLA